jgi:hypothetical protein
MPSNGYTLRDTKRSGHSRYPGRAGACSARAKSRGGKRFIDFLLLPKIEKLLVASVPVHSLSIFQFLLISD